MRCIPLALLAILGALLLAGCGDSVTPSSASTVASTTPETSDEPASGEDEQDDEAVDAQQSAASARAAIAMGRRLDDLEAAFAPVSARVNFLVAADTLRRDGIETDAGELVERERAGAVRVEIGRMRPILVKARTAVQGLPQPQPRTRRIQTLLLASITSRLAALEQLEAVLDAEQERDSDDSAEQLDVEFRASWNESLRATRDATTSVQDIRELLGLDPAPEEALR